MVFRAQVDLNEFREAAAKTTKMKRGPQGGKGNIPKTTILTSSEFNLIIETPVHSSKISASFGSEGKIEVDATQLIVILTNLHKRDGAKDSNVILCQHGFDLLIEGKGQTIVPGVTD